MPLGMVAHASTGVFSNAWLAVGTLRPVIVVGDGPAQGAAVRPCPGGPLYHRDGPPRAGSGKHRSWRRPFPQIGVRSSGSDLSVLRSVRTLRQSSWCRRARRLGSDPCDYGRARIGWDGCRRSGGRNRGARPIVDRGYAGPRNRAEFLASCAEFTSARASADLTVLWPSRHPGATRAPTRHGISAEKLRPRAPPTKAFHSGRCAQGPSIDPWESRLPRRGR